MSDGEEIPGCSPAVSMWVKQGDVYKPCSSWPAEMLGRQTTVCTGDTANHTTYCPPLQYLLQIYNIRITLYSINAFQKHFMALLKITQKITTWTWQCERFPITREGNSASQILLHFKQYLCREFLFYRLQQEEALENDTNKMTCKFDQISSTVPAK